VRNRNFAMPLAALLLLTPVTGSVSFV
jgi:hypothetical protein